MENDLEKTSLKFYDIHRAAIGSGDLIEWAATSTLGRLIRWVTGRDVNHSSLAVKLKLDGLAGRRFILEALADGLELNLLSNSLAGYSGKVYWHQLRPDLEYAREKMVAWALVKKTEHVKYDYGSLFANLFGKVSLDGRRYFCSEFYHAALIHAGLAPAAAAAIRPGGFGSLGLHLPRIRIY